MSDDAKETIFRLFEDPNERLIFRYHDGEKNVDLDPFDVEEKLDKALRDESPTATSTKLDRLRKEYFDSPTDELKRKALKKLAAIAYEVFDLKPFDSATGTGFTIHEAFTVLSFFLAQQDATKKNIESMQPSPPSMDSNPAVVDQITS